VTLVGSIRGAGDRAGNVAPSLPSSRHGMPKLTPMTLSSHFLLILGLARRSYVPSRRCRPLHRSQGKPAVSQSAPRTILPPTLSACATRSSAPGACTSVVGLLRPPAKPSSVRVPNAAACAGLLGASTPSYLCAPLFSMRPTIRSGKRKGSLDCLQPIHTPAHLFWGRASIIIAQQRDSIRCNESRSSGRRSCLAETTTA
jgi:hypothetical protein